MFASILSEWLSGISAEFRVSLDVSLGSERFGDKTAQLRWNSYGCEEIMDDSRFVSHSCHQADAQHG